MTAYGLGIVTNSQAGPIPDLAVAYPHLCGRRLLYGIEVVMAPPRTEVANAARSLRPAASAWALRKARLGGENGGKVATLLIFRCFMTKK
jgi:hypothetical protein